MKKTIIILLSVFYLLVSIGASFNLHYCGGSLKTISLGLDNTKTCCKGKMKKGCCENQQLVIKIDKKQQSTESSQLAFLKVVALKHTVIPPFCFSLVTISSELHVIPWLDSPPFRKGIPIYISNNVFLI